MNYVDNFTLIKRIVFKRLAKGEWHCFYDI
jgi:hypothetical protein